MLTVWEEREESSFSRWWTGLLVPGAMETFSLLLDRENLDDKSTRYFNFSKEGEAEREGAGGCISRGTPPARHDFF